MREVVSHSQSRVNRSSQQGKVIGNQQEDRSSQREVRRRLVGPSSPRVVSFSDRRLIDT